MVLCPEAEVTRCANLKVQPNDQISGRALRPIHLTQVAGAPLHRELGCLFAVLLWVLGPLTRAMYDSNYVYLMF